MNYGVHMAESFVCGICKLKTFKKTKNLLKPKTLFLYLKKLSFYQPCAQPGAPSLLGRCKQKQRGLRGLLCRWPSITE